jgi:hypothetical protein
MAWVAVTLSLAIACLGALGVVSPERLLATVRRFQTPTGLYVAAAIRVALGVALFVAAPTSRAPETLRVFGGVVVGIGLMTPLFGLARYRRLLDWWMSRGSGFVRAWAAIALAFGLLLAYAVAP